MCGVNVGRLGMDPLGILPEDIVKKFGDPLGLGRLFETPNAPKSLGRPPPPPTMQDPAIMQMRSRERRRSLSQSGRRSTILTEGSDLPDMTGPSLLGG